MPTVAAVDIAWLLLCAVLVLLMQAGFTALESGLVRSKSSVNVAIKNFANFLVAAALFWLFGFGLMFGDGGSPIVGESFFVFDSDSAFLAAFFLFELGFIATATTLMSGAVAERMRFAGYLALVFVVAAIVYPIFGHWAWGDSSLTSTSGGTDGWLRELGFIDFAGSTVVHSTGGWAALAAIMIIGPRIGRFEGDGTSIHGHDLPVTTLGVFILWVGWYGFNGGSALALTDDVPAIIQNTTLAAIFGGLVGMALTWRRDRRPDVVMIMNGSLAGLVAVTASANLLHPIGAAVVGGVGAVVMHAVTIGLERARIDDAVGAVPVHLGAGVWGTLAVALLGDVALFPNASNRFEQLGVQLLGVGVCFAWSFGIAYLALRAINHRFPLRIDREGELAGLNIAEHGASTEIADLLADIDEQRRRGDFGRPVRVEPHTEVGRIAAEYNRVLAAISRRTESLQLLRRTAAAANESSSLQEAVAVALDEVCRFTGWPIGHAYFVSRDNQDVLLSSRIWRLDDESVDGKLRDATEVRLHRAGSGLPEIAVRARQPVIVSADGPGADTTDPVTVTVVTFEPFPVASRRTRVASLDAAFGTRAAVWADLGLRAGFAVPIMAGADAVGVLEFMSRQPPPDDDEPLELIMSVSTQLGRVVERERSEEARLRTLIDNMPASVYLRDLQGRFILVNRQYEAFWGISNDALRGKTLWESDPISEVPMAPAVNAEVDRLTRTSGEPQQREARVLRRDKEHVLADVRFPVRDGTGRTVAIAGIDIDITAEKRNQAELAELLRRVAAARDLAMEAASAKSRFLANMSHELRTPLNAIIGFTRLVSRNSEGLAEKQVDNLSKILRSAEHLLVMIDEILDLSRIDAGSVHVELTETDIAAVIRDVADSLEPLIERSRVQLRVVVDPNLPHVVTDRDKVEQILLNLLSNAIKYTDEGTIEVRAEVGDRWAHIGISDTGIGIEPDELDQIFEEFHRADSATARLRRGTGLGLAIARRLARTLDGDITAESQLGIGSTFSLYLPVDAADSAQPPEQRA